MVYSSNLFVVLLPLVVALFYLIPSAAGQRTYLAIASLLFIAYAGMVHLFVFMAVLIVAIVYFVLPYPYRSHQIVYGGVITTLLLILANFKYSGFLSEITGLPLAVLSAGTVIPLGISFYTFTTIGAIYDRRKLQESVSPARFGLFTVFFPHLVAGPIVKYRQLAPQFDNRKHFSSRNIAIGTQLFALGYVKKVLIADPIAMAIDPIWANHSQYSWSALLLAVLGFYVQVYADFSGYTDMGRGIARMLGYRLPINFRAPYLAKNPIEFWSRWHITLSNWVRYYLYTTLSMMVVRRVRTKLLRKLSLAVVIVFTMVLLGLWHGGAWRFIVFGLIQGLVIVMWHLASLVGSASKKHFSFISMLVTQLILILSFVYFRAPYPADATQILVGIATLKQAANDPVLWTGIIICTAATFGIQIIDHFATRRSVARRLLGLRASTVGFLMMSATLLIAFFLKGITLDGVWISPSEKFFGAQSETFIYFAF